MILAKNKNGQIGRKIPAQGFDARIETPAIAERRGNVYLSQAQIEEDQAYWDQVERQTSALRQAEAVANKVRREADKVKHQQEAREVASFQRLAKLDPMNEKLKGYFAKQAGMGESELTIRKLQAPADFSSSGGNLQYVEGQSMTGGDQWRADFRQHLIVGNPLTRDGVYGPAVTDYDRYVQGTDINQWDVVQTQDSIAGGTILGRYDGDIAPAGTGRQALSGMGSDSWYERLTGSLSSAVSQTYENVVDKLPDQLSDLALKELNQLIAGGTANPATGTINVTRPTAGTTTTIVQSQPLPQWAKYAMIGGGVLVGSLILVNLIKAAKS